MNLHLRDPANIGGRIKHMREKRGMTQPELAEAIGIKQPSMSDIESGKSKSPSAINLLKIAHALDANPWWLVTGEGDPAALASAQQREWAGLFASLPEGKRRALMAAARVLKEDAHD